MFKTIRLFVATSVALSSAIFLAACDETEQPKIVPIGAWQEQLPKIDNLSALKIKVHESIYVPFYSQIYDENKSRTTLLTGTLSVRNTDAENGLIIKSIAYYSTSGKLLQQLCETPVSLGPMGTAEIVVPRTHTAGGSGANFVVEWLAEKKIAEPIAEAVMISTGSAQSISFVCRGQVIGHKDADSTNFLPASDFSTPAKVAPPESTAKPTH